MLIVVVSNGRKSTITNTETDTGGGNTLCNPNVCLKIQIGNVT